MVEALSRKVSDSIVEPQALSDQGNSVDPTVDRAGKAGLARNDLALFEKVLGEAGAKLGKSDVTVSAGASSQSPSIHCPSCGSTRVFCDGFRKASLNAVSNEPIQRYRCAEYGHRWSEHIALNVIDNNKQINRISAKILQDAKNLVSAQKTKICAEMERTPTWIKAEIQIDKLLTQLKNDGRRPVTVTNYKRTLRLLLRKNADLFDPEATKAVLASLPMKNNSKDTAVSILTIWFDFNGIVWKKPRYTDDSKVPYVPTEKDIDLLISGLGKRTGTFCQVLKDTGARCGEVSALKWSDIDFGQRLVTLSGEKGSNSRTLKLCSKTIDMLCNLPRPKDRIFAGTSGLRSTFFQSRRRLAKKTANPTLLKIHFHTFRHWKATTEQHKTKDPWHVKMILGHKSIQSTEAYIHLEEMLYQEGSEEFTVKVADTLEDAVKLMEVGFEYHAEVEGHKLFRKRK